jgi:hypothetical protein
MVKKAKELTTSELAERYKVSHSTARGWCTSGKFFPNARLDQTPRGDFWVVPESDLEGFVPPRRGPKPQAQRKEAA